MASLLQRRAKLSVNLPAQSYAWVPFDALHSNSSLCVVLLMQAAVTLAAEPPLCDDPRVLANVRETHALATKDLGLAKLACVVPRETLIGKRSGLDTPKNRQLLENFPFGRSRYCEATLQLGDGTTDYAYYRLDSLKDGPEQDFWFTPCFESLALLYKVSKATICNSSRHPE